MAKVYVMIAGVLGIAGSYPEPGLPKADFRNRSPLLLSLAPPPNPIARAASRFAAPETSAGTRCVEK